MIQTPNVENQNSPSSRKPNKGDYWLVIFAYTANVNTAFLRSNESVSRNILYGAQR